MSEPEFGTDAWFYDTLDAFCLIPQDPDHMNAARYFAAAALRWAADYYATGRPPQGRLRYDHALYAKAAEIEGGK